MKDQDKADSGANKTDKVVLDSGDLELARAIRDLEMSIAPTRDLWSGIERKIADHPQGTTGNKPFNWMPYGVAASLVAAVMSLTVSLGGLNASNANQLGLVSSDESINRMSVEHVQVMNPLVTRFNQVNENLAPETLEDIYRNLEIMEAARRDIEARVRQDPDDHRLVEMLMKIHEQELELLRQDFTPSGRF